MPAEKEPLFFTGYPKTLKTYLFDGTDTYHWMTTELAEYAALFEPARDNQITGESSTWYLSHHETVIPTIRDVYGEMADQLSIIIMLRNPAERVWSHWNLKRGSGREPLSFESAIQSDTIRERIENGFSPSYNYLRFSRYCEDVAAWVHAFPRTRVFIYEEFYRNLDAEMLSLLDFLGIAPHPKMQTGKTVNTSGQPRNAIAARLLRVLISDSFLKEMLKWVLPVRWRKNLKRAAQGSLLHKQPLKPDLKNMLMEQYMEDIANLERLLDRSLDIWRTESTS